MGWPKGVSRKDMKAKKIADMKANAENTAKKALKK